VRTEVGLHQLKDDIQRTRSALAVQRIESNLRYADIVRQKRRARNMTMGNYARKSETLAMAHAVRCVSSDVRVCPPMWPHPWVCPPTPRAPTAPELRAMITRIAHSYGCGWR
jgi:hypothetical protein